MKNKPKLFYCVDKDKTTQFVGLINEASDDDYFSGAVFYEGATCCDGTVRFSRKRFKEFVAEYREIEMWRKKNDRRRT